ncbi:Yip1 family protein [Reinekea blandensis]|uniref:Yip1 domain-containing protein n=1 Tax=Reinekea blandensis MED297 TaxID=314283 RepID=A4BB43_9GAMM|nr:Yip1 family protein [Reinekea blandensis]EAR10656.1 hypothetical protein MED297_11590 [Reinekea sp. MED297] [Reinekea blandensis MED297]
MERSTETYLNPWFSIWTQPRATIRQIIRTNPKQSVILLAALGGFAEALDRASYKDAGDDFSVVMIVLMAMSLGALGGILAMYVYGWLLSWTGNWINGQGHREEIRAAIAWANVPVIWALLLWIPQYALIGREMFMAEAYSLTESTTTFVLFFGLAVIEVILGIWAFIIFLKCLGEVQGFSAWKALWNCIIPLLVVGLPFVLIIGLFTW